MNTRHKTISSHRLWIWKHIFRIVYRLDTLQPFQHRIPIIQRVGLVPRQSGVKQVLVGGPPDIQPLDNGIPQAVQVRDAFVGELDVRGRLPYVMCGPKDVAMREGRKALVFGREVDLPVGATPKVHAGYVWHGRCRPVEHIGKVARQGRFVHAWIVDSDSIGEEVDVHRGWF